MIRAHTLMHGTMPAPHPTVTTPTASAPPPRSAEGDWPPPPVASRHQELAPGSCDLETPHPQRAKCIPPLAQMLAGRDAYDEWLRRSLGSLMTSVENEGGDAGLLAAAQRQVGKTRERGMTHLLTPDLAQALALIADIGSDEDITPKNLSLEECCEVLTQTVSLVPAERRPTFQRVFAAIERLNGESAAEALRSNPPNPPPGLIAQAYAWLFGFAGHRTPPDIGTLVDLHEGEPGVACDALTSLALCYGRAVAATLTDQGVVVAPGGWRRHQVCHVLVPLNGVQVLYARLNTGEGNERSCAGTPEFVTPEIGLLSPDDTPLVGAAMFVQNLHNDAQAAVRVFDDLFARGILRSSDESVHAGALRDFRSVVARLVQRGCSCVEQSVLFALRCVFCLNIDRRDDADSTPTTRASKKSWLDREGAATLGKLLDEDFARTSRGTVARVELVRWACALLKDWPSEACRLIDAWCDRIDPDLTDDQGNTAPMLIVRALGRSMPREVATWLRRWDARLNLDLADDQGRTLPMLVAMMMGPSTPELARDLVRLWEDRVSFTTPNAAGQTLADVVQRFIRPRSEGSICVQRISMLSGTAP